MEVEAEAKAEEDAKPLLCHEEHNDGIMAEFRGGSSSYCKDFDWRAPAIVLGFVSLESLGFSGIATNLVIYLSRILRENNASIATSITAWTGTSYFTPLLGAVLADSYFGSYRMIFLSSLIYLAGMRVLSHCPPYCHRRSLFRAMEIHVHPPSRLKSSFSTPAYTL